MIKKISYLISLLLLCSVLSCDFLFNEKVVVRITGIESVYGAEYEVGAFSYNKLSEGLLAGAKGIIYDSVTNDVLKEVSESYEYSSSAPEKQFVRGEELYIGARIIHNGKVYETENLELITVREENIVYISFNDMVEKDTRPLQQ